MKAFLYCSSECEDVWDLRQSNDTWNSLMRAFKIKRKLGNQWLVFLLFAIITILTVDLPKVLYYLWIMQEMFVVTT